ncbi:histone H2A deubiquitinase MYSM1 isoform X1 [Polypterus senegalus]|uniref:histone H2A deubiquitinase MYSM1 isoform X1 n=1 Tax=Polypterus senegalus TaxID=55291 RepID=UPI0019631131|nr:histone H2A deubiquitinase MYSM1 isoform X1 [Polypterus senegalus]
MAEEVDVVGLEGGDEPGLIVSDTGASGFLHDQYLQSAWRANSEFLPWMLDNSISEENKAVIENMLLEEEYYLTGRGLPQNMRLQERKGGDKAKRSPVKPTNLPVRWSQEEKELFETGLTQFGRRWTKIAKLIGSRTVLQVKSYARQYFRNKAKSALIPKQNSSLEVPQDVERELPDTQLNMVRIERLSDDEEVDITDDSDGGGSQQADKVNDASLKMADAVGQKDGEESQLLKGLSSSSGEAEFPDFSPPCVEEKSVVEEPGLDCLSVPTTTSGHLEYKVYPAPSPVRSENEQTYKTEEADNNLGSESDEATEHQPFDETLEEEEILKPPEKEIEMDPETITEEEKQAIPEFFEGRPSKTPERYLRIRNYILEQWKKCHPKYLNKTSVRPGLKNCGDVNCIGRIHTYLELVGAINFGCEQAVYNRPRIVDKVRFREGGDTLEAFQLAQRLQSMRTRKRRVRDVWGNWCDAKDLEGQTFEHLTAEELAKRREEEPKRFPRPPKHARQAKNSFDPFQLIPCQSFGEETQEPFQVLVAPEALVVMDMHSHVSMGEVIGLLGGKYSESERILKINAAEPCHSLSTGLQCEMDPVSQTQASEALERRGYSVVGWYHSHPAFDPNPSLRDIDTQAKFQTYFTRGGAQFIGMIISPYNPTNVSPHSQVTCLIVSEELNPTASHRLPFKFEVQPAAAEPDWSEVLKKAQWITEKYSLAQGSVPMDRIFHKASDMTCLEKMLASMRKSLDPLLDVNLTGAYLAQIEMLFKSCFPAEGESGAKAGEPGCPLEQ